jgi:23S rRNA (cytidine1920-2'-O)/16S rRNA (cytidine1409-2'-O)-methyltransferase
MAWPASSSTATRRAAPTSRRLDVWLVEHGLAESREKAQALVMAGRVRLDGRPATKAGTPVPRERRRGRAPGPEHVGRGALKLEGALDAFGVDPRGRTCVDVGASTGGFTETLLRRGAARVYAVDVGRGSSTRACVRTAEWSSSSASTPATSPRARCPKPAASPPWTCRSSRCTKLLAPLRTVLAPEADVLVLVKPQFEVGRGQVGRGGIVKAPEKHLQALRDVAAAAQSEAKLAVVAASPSPILGMEGNREFFLHLRTHGRARLAPAEIEDCW